VSAAACGGYVETVEVAVSDDGGFPSYPYRKVVIVGGRAEVAETAYEGKPREQVVRHAELESLLRSRHPGLAADAEWIAGYVTQHEGEATLHLHLTARGLSSEDVARIRRALSGWAAAHGVTRLTIVDVSRRDGSPNPPGDWALP
jgi:hypothetical protein